MSAVWRAQDERIERPVAIKVLSEVLALDEDYVQRFRREARIAASLSHPNLVRIYDFGSEGERPYLVMEFMEDGTLVDRSAGSTVAELGLAAGLLGALDHIHTAEVLHRDVKPANVLFDADGRPRLTDFGIAQPADATQITHSGQVIGTLRYMAPEVREGAKASVRSDLYSAGAVLEERLSDASPPELIELADRLTMREPEARPRSAATALGVLESADPEVSRQAAAPTDILPIDGRRRKGRELEVPLAAALSVLAAVAAIIVAL